MEVEQEENTNQEDGGGYKDKEEKMLARDIEVSN